MESDAQGCVGAWDKGMLKLGVAGDSVMPWRAMFRVGTMLRTRGCPSWDLEGVMQQLGE